MQDKKGGSSKNIYVKFVSYSQGQSSTLSGARGFVLEEKSTHPGNAFPQSTQSIVFQNHPNNPLEGGRLLWQLVRK